VDMNYRCHGVLKSGYPRF